MTDAESAALGAAVRALNIAKPSYGQARAALRAGTVALKGAYPAADKLPSTGAASRTAAHRDLDAANLALAKAFHRLPSTSPEQAAIPAGEWNEVRTAVVHAYQEAFVVKATAADAGKVSFVAELADLQRNLAEAPAFFDAAAKALGKGVATVVGGASSIIGSTALGLVKGLWPVLLVVGVGLVAVVAVNAGVKAKVAG